MLKWNRAWNLSPRMELPLDLPITSVSPTPVRQQSSLMMLLWSQLQVLRVELSKTEGISNYFASVHFSHHCVLLRAVPKVILYPLVPYPFLSYATKWRYSNASWGTQKNKYAQWWILPHKFWIACRNSKVWKLNFLRFYN